MGAGNKGLVDERAATTHVLPTRLLKDPAPVPEIAFPPFSAWQLYHNGGLSEVSDNLPRCRPILQTKKPQTPSPRLFGSELSLSLQKRQIPLLDTRLQSVRRDRCICQRRPTGVLDDKLAKCIPSQSEMQVAEDVLLTTHFYFAYYHRLCMEPGLLPGR